MTAADFPPHRNILVIKLGALGDFIQALGPMDSIRRHHRDARLVLLTTDPYVSLAEASGWFDEVWSDKRPRWWQVPELLTLRRQLRHGGFDRVYDLQTSDRSGLYFRMMRHRTGGQVLPEWSGIAAGCSHPHANPRRDAMHTVDRQAEQLETAGVPPVPAPELEWLDAPVDDLAPSDRFVLLVPGGSPHRPGKRWPPERYAALARDLWLNGYRPVLLGTAVEKDVMQVVNRKCPDAVNLTGKTSLLDIAGLARCASGAVGNDTGPMHIIAAVGCPAVVLFSEESDPGLCGPRGPFVTTIRRKYLGGLAQDEVAAALRLR